MTPISRISIRRLTQRDDTDATAIGVMVVHLHAYADRLGWKHWEALRRMLHANLRTDLEATREQLRRGPNDGWYWVAALEKIWGVEAVRGFALCIVQPEGIFLAEIHTIPLLQRRGLGRAMLREVFRYVADGLQGMAVAELTITLNVARQQPHDPTEHPFAWYELLGFVPIGAGEDLVFGEVRLPTIRMQAALGDVLRNLQIDRGDTVD